MIESILIPNSQTGIVYFKYINKNKDILILGNKDDIISYDIILIDTEAEIEENNLVYSILYGIGRVLPGNYSNYKGEFPRLVQYKNISVPYSKNGYYSNNNKKIYKNDCSKIITSTNKNHNLPKLSDKSIQLLIDYYNKNKCMPKSINTEINIGENNGKGSKWHPNYNIYMDIIIPENEINNKSINIPSEILEILIYSYINYEFDGMDSAKILDKLENTNKWLNKNKLL